jgi:hypothetical protein
MPSLRKERESPPALLVVVHTGRVTLALADARNRAIAAGSAGQSAPRMALFPDEPLWVVQAASDAAFTQIRGVRAPPPLSLRGGRRSRAGDLDYLQPTPRRDRVHEIGTFSKAAEGLRARARPAASRRARRSTAT